MNCCAMGGVGFHDLSTAAIEVMQNYDNIMGIGSAIRPIKLLKALKTLGAERVAFGSDTPFNLTHVEVAAYQALLEDEFTENEKQQIMAGNIARWLNLDL